MATLSSALRRASLLVSALAITLALWPVLPAAAESEPAAPIVRYAGVLRTFNPHLSLAQSKDMATHVLLVSSYYGLDPRLLVAIVGVESSWHVGAVSRLGAQGLGQLMPATADVLGVLAFDAYENLDGTARYLRRMMQQYAQLTPEARTTRAIAGYNAGPAAVARAGGVPAIPETRTYVARVMDLWHRLQNQLPGSVVIAPPAPHAAPHAVVARGVRAAPSSEEARGSVADFTALEVRSMEVLPAANVTAVALTPNPPERRGLRRWWARAFASR